MMSGLKTLSDDAIRHIIHNSDDIEEEMGDISDEEYNPSVWQ